MKNKTPKFDAMPRKTPTWLGKKPNEMNLREARGYIRELERQINASDKLIAKAHSLLTDCLP